MPAQKVTGFLSFYLYRDVSEKSKAKDFAASAPIERLEKVLDFKTLIPKINANKGKTDFSILLAVHAATPGILT